ncbi:hypothetical protein [Halalkalicoccus subterraneus]|uniref:hypothetical protein n=1 Tax=Halalkalicoccus subterraneus TaxID=2675002 RepID=UPI000EFA91E6|nr:hypothetical protein [Halalkalicoccus subterraneus]
MIWMYAATLFATFNVCMLLALTYIWVTNYRRFRTAITLGFLCFGIVLLVENLLAIYFFFGTDEFYTTVAAQQMVLVLRLLESIALICLSWVIVR